jgi:SHS family lactate transporter-like MFS transporter
MSWTREQRNVTIAAYLGWTLDAFDFFLMVFVLKDIAAEFNTKIPDVAFAITLTLAMRPLGALLFGRLADKFGRRPTLMINIACYSLLELLSGLSPNLTTLLILRALFGIAMGGEWGVGSALTMETVPTAARGVVSGLLQAGYPSGYLLASIAFGVVYPFVGWRGMFFIGVAPALLVMYVRAHVPESPAWRAMEKRPRPGLIATLKRNWTLSLYAIVLMTAFNFFSHGTQDLYPTFLQVQQHYSPATVGIIAVIYNIGAILGSLTFGSLSERIGRRRAIVIAALISLPVLPLWALAGTPLWFAVGSFLMQFMVQAAWGIIPVHLNELSPATVRGIFPGFVYQLGNLLASVNATIQADYAAAHNNDYATALMMVAGGSAIAISLLVWFGVERKGVHLDTGSAAPRMALSGAALAPQASE